MIIQPIESREQFSSAQRRQTLVIWTTFWACLLHLTALSKGDVWCSKIYLHFPLTYLLTYLLRQASPVEKHSLNDPRHASLSEVTPTHFYQVALGKIICKIRRLKTSSESLGNFACRGCPRIYINRQPDCYFKDGTQDKSHRSSEV